MKIARKLTCLFITFIMLAAAGTQALAFRYYEDMWKLTGAVDVQEKMEDGKAIIQISDTGNSIPPVYSVAQYFYPETLKGKVTIKFDFKQIKSGNNTFHIMEFNGVSQTLFPITFLEGEDLIAFNNDHAQSLPAKSDEWCTIVLDIDTDDAHVKATCTSDGADSTLEFDIKDPATNAKKQNLDVNSFTLNMQQNGIVQLGNFKVFPTGNEPATDEIVSGSEDEIKGDESIKVRYNGELMQLKTLPFISEGGRTMVPVRGIFENMDAYVHWDNQNRRVLVMRYGDTIRLTIDDTKADVNGETKEMDQPAQLLGGRTYIPLRFISEALGADVAFDEATTTIDITLKEDIQKQPRTPVEPPETNEVWIGPHPWGSNEQGGYAPYAEYETIFMEPSKWEETFSKATGVKIYIDVFHPDLKYNLPKLRDMVDKYNLKVDVEVGGQKMESFLTYGSDVGIKAAQRDIRLLKNWTDIGGRLDSISEDHAIMYAINDNQYTYNRGLYMQMIYNQMLYFKEMERWYPGLDFGLIESLGFFKVHGRNGKDYSQSASLADQWYYQDFLDDALDIADRVGVRLNHFDVDYSFLGVKLDTFGVDSSGYQFGDPIDYNKVITVQEYSQQNGVKCGIIFNEIIWDGASEQEKNITTCKSMIEYYNGYHEAGGKPDKAIIQSWFTYPFEGPESEPYTFFWTAKEMLKDVPAIQRPELEPSAPDPDYDGVTSAEGAPVQVDPEDRSEIAVSELLADSGRWSLAGGAVIDSGKLNLVKGDGALSGYDQPYLNQTFTMDIEMLEESEGNILIQLRADHKADQPWNLTQGYFFIINKEGVELQKKLPDGQMPSLKKLDTPIFANGKPHTVKASAVNTDMGVKLTFYLDKRKVLEVMDTANTITDAGYLNLCTMVGGAATIS